MSLELKGDLVFDTSALLELIGQTPIGVAIEQSLEANTLYGYVSEVSLSEAIYVLCRRLGHDKSKAKISALIDSGYFRVEETTVIFNLAGEYKCDRSISLVDCFSLALGKLLHFPILFATREKELEREIKAKPFDVKVIFLEDYARRVSKKQKANIELA